MHRENRIRRRPVVSGGGGGDGITNVDPWHYIGETGEPAFENSFFAVGTQKAGFRKVGDYIEISGLFLGGAAATTIFTLPVDYRPDFPLRSVAIAVDISVGGAVSQFDGIYVMPDGSVKSGDNPAAFTVPLWSVPTGTFSPLIAPEDV